jgi:nucleoside phosphorylase
VRGNYGMIVITFALPTESSALVGRLREASQVSSHGEKIVQGKIDKRSIAIFHTGVGPKSCSGKIENLFRNERPEFLLSSGFAGSARDDLQVGDIILAENFSDRHLLWAAQKLLRLTETHVVNLFTSSTIIDSITERDEIARVNSAAAVDMETETIARACAARGIRMLSLRVISDSAREPFPAPPRILFDIERQRTDFAKLIGYSLRPPDGAWRLLRFARQIARARKALTDAIVTVATAL